MRCQEDFYLLKIYSQNAQVVYFHSKVRFHTLIEEVKALFYRFALIYFYTYLSIPYLFTFTVHASCLFLTIVKNVFSHLTPMLLVINNPLQNTCESLFVLLIN